MGAPNRFRSGWAAWEATAGYIAIQYSPDVTVSFIAEPVGASDDINWTGRLEWAGKAEKVQTDTLPAAMNDLWATIDFHHLIFKTRSAALKKPAGFQPDEWLDERTTQAIDRLLTVVQRVFADDWALAIFYHPTEDAGRRYEVRLLAGHEQPIWRGARGATMRDALHALYRASFDAIAAHIQRNQADT